MNNPKKYITGLMVTFFDKCFEQIAERGIAGFISLDDL
jgi:hypothetical protein